VSASALPRTPFRAFRLRAEGDGGEPARIELDDLTPGDVVIRAAWSSVNYKDALAGTGGAPIARRLPLNGGIDVAGTVVAADGGEFEPGEAVLVTGCGLSEDRDGGYAEYVRVPADSVIRLPAGIDARSAMTLGTAGFTAGLALLRLETNGLAPGQGPVAVTGATGGVGSVAIDLLAGRGYEVVAVTGKRDADAYLRALGAGAVIDRDEILATSGPLARARWAGAIDNAGGDMLAGLLRTTRAWGSVAGIGLAAGQGLETTVMPFIIRGVSLLGITSANCPRQHRETVWQRLAGDWHPRHLDRILAGETDLDGLPAVFRALLAGRSRGRTLVRIGADDQGA